MDSPVKPVTLRLVDDLLQRLAAPLAEARREGRELATITLALDSIRLHSLPQLAGDWFYWGSPRQDSWLLGRGEVRRLAADGPDRLRRLAEAFERLRGNWLHLDPDRTRTRACAFVGFAFNPEDPMTGRWSGLPNAALFFPELLLSQTGNRCALSITFTTAQMAETTTAPAERWRQQLLILFSALRQMPEVSGSRSTLTRIDSTPSESEWLARVNRVTDLIRSGRAEKVVLARRIEVKARRRINPARLMATLECLYPLSTHFSISLQERVFAAATPERLLNLSDGRIVCDAIGGTGDRAQEEGRDILLGERLRTDPKTRHEHHLVVQDIRQRLHPLCNNLRISSEPGLLRLRNLQHLRTEISGRFRESTNLLQAADALHPTAAVNGFPGAAAMEWLGSHEEDLRGWYTGAAGWIDNRGDGELAVLLRCALLRDDNAELFAGAGITAGSDAATELHETELKFSTMLEALENA